MRRLYIYNWLIEIECVLIFIFDIFFFTSWIIDSLHKRILVWLAINCSNEILIFTYILNRQKCALLWFQESHFFTYCAHPINQMKMMVYYGNQRYTTGQETKTDSSQEIFKYRKIEKPNWYHQLSILYSTVRKQVLKEGLDSVFVYWFHNSLLKWCQLSL